MNKGLGKRGRPMYKFDFRFLLEKFPVLLGQGALMTIELTILTLLLATLIGVVLASFRISKNAILRAFAAIYVWAFRGIPMLLLLFFLYYALPTVGVYLSPFAASITALTLVASSYMCEIIRGGILGIDVGQFEVCKSFGYTYPQQMFHIIIPQTLRAIVPPVGNEFIGIMKDTTIVSTVAMVETVRVAQQVGAASFKYVEIYTGAVIIFLIMTSVFTVLFNKIEGYLKKHA